MARRDSAPDLLSSLQAHGGLQAWTARANRPTQSLGRMGALEVRLAQTAAEVRQAQKLRYRILYQEGFALPTPGRLYARRDVDRYDAICEHLLVINHAVPGKPEVVGTNRLLPQSLAEKHGGFCASGEFDIGELIASHSNLQFLELGRACMLALHRANDTVELLWHGIHAYALQNRIDVMLGCASLEGTDPKQLSLPLSFLHHYARAPEAWRGSAWPKRHVEMNQLPKDAIDPKQALRALPPLLKNYLRLGAFVGEGAVVNAEFGTTDVLVVMPMSAIKKRYAESFSLSQHAA